MNKKAIVAAALLVAIGLIAFTAVMAASGWDLAKLSTQISAIYRLKRIPRIFSYFPPTTKNAR